MRSGAVSLRLLSALGIGTLVFAWHVSVHMADQSLLPDPAAVIVAIVDLARSGRLVQCVVASLFRVTWGYLAAVALGVPLGLALGWYWRPRLAFAPLIQLFRPISPLAWTPIAILWFGVGDLSAVFIIFLASLWPITVYAMNAVRSIPAVHVQVGLNFGLQGARLLRRVLLPAAWSQVLVGLRVSLGIAWLVDVAAEMLAVNSGLGFLVIDSRNAGNRYDLVVAGMLLIGVIGLSLDAAMGRMQQGRVSRLA